MPQRADFPTLVRITGLFGRSGYIEVPLRSSERITLLTGPNGSGKTHILRLLRAALALDMYGLAQLPFSSADFVLSSGRKLTIERIARPAEEEDDSVEPMKIQFVGFDAGGSKIDQYAEEVVSGLEDRLPDFMRQVGPELWEDIRDGELLALDELGPRFRIPMRLLRSSRDRGFDLPPWLEHFRHSPGPTLIETSRLDIARVRTPRRSLGRESTPPRSQIEVYIERIESEMDQARRESLSVSQVKDRQFAQRALDKDRLPVGEAEIAERYLALTDLHQELSENGLTSEAMTVAFPAGDTDSTERRILDLFLEDWEAKLAPLRPVHEKLQLLRSIVDTKLATKSMNLRDGRLQFIGSDTGTIPLEALSSGEQHLLALFTMLLFSAEENAVVLIDEPEISLHASWKHAFLDDIRRVAEVKQLWIVAATHSTAIINGEWGLVEELSEIA